MKQGITLAVTVNIHRDHFGIKSEDYLSKYGFIFSPFVSVNVSNRKKGNRIIVLFMCESFLLAV